MWVEGNANSDYVLGWGWKDFVKKNDENWKKGSKLEVLDSYVQGGQVLFNAVWEQSNENSNYVLGWGCFHFLG